MESLPHENRTVDTGTWRMKQLGPFKENLPTSSPRRQKYCKDLYLWCQSFMARPPILAGVSALALASQICVQHLC